MNTYKALAQNFDSSYIYKVEEREETEQIICESDRGLLSIENIELPKVTRYFLKNVRGERQGYIERKLIQNLDSEVREDNESTINRSNCISGNETLQPAPNRKNQRIKIDSQVTLQSVAKSNNMNKNSKRLEQRRPKSTNKVSKCVALDNNLFGSSKNFTLDFTSSNSTPSDETRDINNKLSAVDKGKDITKMTTAKPFQIFCNDPNKRLKNLFTIVRQNEENKNDPKCSDIDLLNKTKDLLVQLIDNELQRVQSDVEQDDGINRQDLKKLKMECIARIEEGLTLMKRLEQTC